MRYRALDNWGDYSLGKPWLVNSPAAVAQAVLTRLLLWRGEWFVDTTDGTPYSEEVLGKLFGTRNPQVAIKQRILGTPGVIAITSFSSSFNGDTRELLVNATIDTAFGPATISQVL